MINWLEEQLLSFLQRRCPHPGEMVAVDVLEGCGDYEIAYCRRCGAIDPKVKNPARRPARGPFRNWILPSPNLWRGL